MIKKFQAATENEAMLQVKEEMGSDAVIMNIKKTRHRGIMSLFKPTVVEVTAALEEPATGTAEQSTESVRTGTLNLVADEPVSIHAAEIKPKYNPNIILDEPKETWKQEKSQEDTNAIEEKLNNLQSMLEKQIKKEREDSESDGNEEEENETVQFLQLIYNTLIDNEVDEKYANQIVDEMSGAKKTNMSVDALMGNVYQKMILKFGEVAPVKEAKNGGKIIFFIGPTGVGKTTTVAKIASKLKLEEKKKVVLLTTDTYRIAATEQLRTYAEILDVPFQVIYSGEELLEAQETYKEYDFILVDTAGHSPTNEEQHADLKHFVNSVNEKMTRELYLVMSATTKYKDLLRIVDSYEDMKGFRLIFTKLDETSECGNILNIRMYTKAKLSYVTYGQNVPEDIQVFDAQATVKKLLGGN